MVYALVIMMQLKKNSGKGLHELFQKTPPSAANIMFDKRVIRGSTYAATAVGGTVKTETEASEPKPAPPKKGLQGRSSKSRAKLENLSADADYEPAEPVDPLAPVPGRLHTEVQTDKYLEELKDHPDQDSLATQTDPFLDRPSTPLFVPPKRGIDVTTQIESGDLFDFDQEVVPLLEVLVGKTLEQALMEVAEEEELSALRARQEQMEMLRNAELVAAQRMEAAEQRRAEEKERRLEEEKKRVEEEVIVQEKVAAAVFAKAYIADLANGLVKRMYDENLFYDPVKKDVEDNFMPWLYDQVDSAAVFGQVVHNVVAGVVAAAVRSN